MTGLLVALASVVAVVAAARSTWSPCGLSMLSTVTPFSEQARGSSFRATATWFVLGATVGGATLGLAMALLALGVGSLHLTPLTSGLLALAAALVAVISDSGVARVVLPYHRRQVNERWLDQYRPWVYGSGFGWQIGCGVATYITTAAVYLMVVLGILAASPSGALTVGAAFGLFRGLAVLLTARLKTPIDLRAFHRRFMAVGPAVNRAVIVVEGGVAVALGFAVPTVTAVVVVAGAAVTVLTGRLVTRGVGGTIGGPGCAIPQATAGSGDVPLGFPDLSRSGTSDQPAR